MWGSFHCNPIKKKICCGALNLYRYSSRGRLGHIGPLGHYKMNENRIIYFQSPAQFVTAFFDWLIGVKKIDQGGYQFYLPVIKIMKKSHISTPCLLLILSNQHGFFPLLSCYRVIVQKYKSHLQMLITTPSVMSESKLTINTNIKLSLL